jgi:hypothetical protein
LIKFLWGLSKKYHKRRGLRKRIAIGVQKEIMASFPEPRDCVERSYFQYKCHRKLIGPLYDSAANIASFFLMYGLLFMSLFSREKASTERGQPRESADAVFFANTMKADYLSRSITDRYKTIAYSEYAVHRFFDKDDRKFVLSLLKRKPLRFFFAYKIAEKVATYHGEMALHSPKAIIVSAEYSFTSSAMTEYCRMKGVRHICVQHGEKAFGMIDAFFLFDEYHAWTDEHVKIMEQLCAPAEQFIVAPPPMLENIRNAVAASSPVKEYDYKYYLSGETKAELRSLYDSLSRLAHGGHKVCVRNHPRYSDMGAVRKVLVDIDIEDSAAVSITDSLCKTRAAVSIGSAVLFQADFAGIETVVDDISIRERFDMLVEAGFTMIGKSRKLSDLLAEEENVLCTKRFMT